MAGSRPAETEQPSGEHEVLPPGEHHVDAGLLAGDPEQTADGGGVGDDVVAEHADPPGIRAAQGRDRVDEGRLAGAVGPEQGEDAGADVEAEVVQHEQVAVAGDEAVDGNNCVRHMLSMSYTVCRVHSGRYPEAVTAAPTPVPRALAIAWGFEEAPRRGPRRELTHDAIARAAVAIADEGGLGAVTMARVAESLGFTTMSLYRYVASKDELVMLMQDTAADVAGDLEVSADDWRQGLRDIAGLQLEIYAHHPWFLDVPLSLQSVLMPNNMRFADATYRAMRTLPADDALKQAVLLSLSMYVRAFGQLHRDLQSADVADISPATIDLLGQVVTPERFPDLAPVFRSGGYTGEDPGSADATDDFAIGLDLFISGLEARVAGAR